MSAQLIISEMTTEQRQSAVERLSEQPLNVLQAAREILAERLDLLSNLGRQEPESNDRLGLLEEAIVHKAFENLLDLDCIPEQEKYRKVVNMRRGKKR